MITANQLYKMSNSSLPFKQWLKDNQDKGLLDNHEKMYNLIEGEVQEEEIIGGGESNSSTYSTKPLIKPTTQKSFTQLTFVNVVALIGIGILLYGLSKSSSNN